ncbi:cupin 2 barrel domain-containing protein [Natronococcus amylolyticus DSM 10524]|uniref:Cupin 2 barrel domain-containing protein n=1 Tax=Natronococcus amylolyticus DSM 10524 TaxID=1227497 RepID=L9XCQ3_9EURY|nr:cupin domain-containing protein [Natronococcus amylolyticus]ELY59226.1 cupin 2 barrel domain-containing protein [Natronococcus amylolyticus DSM 10524]
MAEYTTANYHDVDDQSGLHFLRDELNCENVGVTVLECEPGWEGMEHDHADEGQEEVYLLLEGEATVTVEDESVELSEGDAIRIPPDATHQIHNGDAESRFVLVGAP